MDILGTANKPDAAHAITMRIDCFMSSFNNKGMRGKPQIIVGAKIQNGSFGSITARQANTYFCSLGTTDNSFSFVKTRSFYFFNFLSNTTDKILIHGAKIETIRNS